jgi:hypothetical protein
LDVQERERALVLVLSYCIVTVATSPTKKLPFLVMG